jgi:hypothetical protein
MGWGDSQNAGLGYRLVLGHLFWECPHPRSLPYTYRCATASGWCVPEIMGPQPPGSNPFLGWGAVISGSPQPWGVTLHTKTCPYFSSVFRWPLSGTRTQPVSSEMEEIFHSRSSHPLKIRAAIYNKEWPYPSPVQTGLAVLFRHILRFLVSSWVGEVVVICWFHFQFCQFHMRCE